MKQLLFIVITLIFFNVSAQEKCATDIYQKLNSGRVDNLKQENLKRIQQLRNKRTAVDGVIVIPVVVHIIHSSKNNIVGESGNISDEQIISQFEVLKEDYRRMFGTNGYNDNPVGADVEIEFCLATSDPDCLPSNGITRHYSEQKTFSPVSISDNELIKSLSDWPNTEYLNIWVCSLSGGYLGYSQFPNYTNLDGVDEYNGPPEEDGVIISQKVFGSKTGTASSGIYSLGRTVTHEIGHWLGLKHTWGDDFCGNDYCDDTPPCSGSFLEKKCGNVYSTCENGITTRNMIENYLDYSPDACMNIFTLDQKARMRSVFTNSPDRIQILSSNGCQSHNIAQLPFIMEFENQSMVADQWTSFPSSNGNWKYFSNGAFGNSLSSVMTSNGSSNSGEVNILSSSPYVDVEGTDNPVVAFDLAYPNLEHTDTLIISIYDGCKAPAVIVKYYAGDELITTSVNDPGFLPQKKDWKTFYISLKSFVSRKFIKIQFENHSAGGGNIYLDNIRIYKSTKDFTSKSNGNLVVISSNPSYDLNYSRLKMDVSFEGPSDIYFEVFDLNGNNIASKGFLNSVPGDYYINNLPLLSGLYLVKTTVNGQVSVDKVVVIAR